MTSKITPDHLGREAAVYIRQSTMGQVVGNTESQMRQYSASRSAFDPGAIGTSAVPGSRSSMSCILGRAGARLIGGLLLGWGAR